MMMIMMMIMINLIIMFNIDINNDDIYHRSYGWLDKKNPKTMMNAKKKINFDDNEDDEDDDDDDIDSGRIS